MPVSDSADASNPTNTKKLLTIAASVAAAVIIPGGLIALAYIYRKPLADKLRLTNKTSHEPPAD